MITRSKAGLQERSAKKTGWGKERRKQFLETLSTTCNVERSARSAGMTAQSAYRLRNRDHEFALLWATAVAAGTDRLKERVLAHQLSQEVSDEHPGDLAEEPAAIPFDPNTALKTLQTLAALERRGGRGGDRPDYATDAEVNALLMERLNALARKRGDA